MSEPDKEEWEQRYTAAEQKRINEVWEVPPAECNGSCKIVESCLVSCCVGCGWDDW